jgi:hypothetical protein
VFWPGGTCFSKMRTTMGREKKQIMEEAYAGISSSRTVNRTQDVDAFEGFFQYEGIVVKVYALSAKTAHLMACQ